jgi:lysophospholipid acyltransferase (LPLAT)-like uncharacterized protein
MKAKILSHIASLILRFWNLFVRVMEVSIPEQTELLFSNQGGFILAGWHNQILSLTVHCSKELQKKRKIKLIPLVSHSKDGEYIYETFLRFGMESVRGSSSRGGAKAFRHLLKLIKSGNVPIFTPDGPRGPIYKVQLGLIQLAQMTNVPIVLFNSVYDNYYEFKSWDKHRFPKFFAKQWILYSEPIQIPQKMNEEEMNQILENVQFKMLEQIDILEVKRNKNKEN